jgi:hypothetical protein
MTCVMKNDDCRGALTEWRIWKEGEQEAVAVSLCGTHSRPLLPLWRVGAREPLPTKPRVALEPTKLKPIAGTRHLKK